MNTQKIRLDALLIRRGYCDSERMAQALIMDGKVLVKDQKIVKPGTPVLETSPIRILGQTLRYVSRAGDKLHGAWEQFHFPIEDKVALDIGLSTGGFTDFLKQHGIRQVFGVDVSYGIVDFQLRQWPHLILLERTNARMLTKEPLSQAAYQAGFPGAEVDISLVVMDVSFISVLAIVPALLHLVRPETDFILLIKPQFEADSNDVPEGGVILDKTLQASIVERVKTSLCGMGLTWKGTCTSPVTGTKGNQEFFLWMTN